MRRVMVVFALVVVACAGQRAESANERGRACLDRRDLKCAATEFGEAVRLDPGVSKYHHNLALAFAKMRHYDQALSECREALRLDPGNVQSSALLTQISRRIETRQADEISALLAH